MRQRTVAAGPQRTLHIIIRIADINGFRRICAAAHKVMPHRFSVRLVLNGIVGGDDDGALALGQYKQYFDKYGYEMHFIVNTKRPLTRTNDELIEIAERIESASRLKFTDIYNNTNLSDQTDETTLFSGYDEIKMLSKKMGIVITKNCGIDKALSNVPTNLKDTVFRMNICILRPWEIQ